MTIQPLPIPEHYKPDTVGQVWRVPYQQRAAEAERYARRHGIGPAGGDGYRICLVLVDVQNTFCIPGFELYVGGASGNGAVDDNRRLCQFIYRNLATVTEICPTMDTHQAAQIFHAVFLVDEQGRHPEPYTLISIEDVRQGRWRFNPKMAGTLGIDAAYGQEHLRQYIRRLRETGKYELTVWPYHAMFGGIGHALVSAVEEAVFFHGIARCCQPRFEVKGNNPLTENYSVLRPEVLAGPRDDVIAEKNTALIQKILDFDAVVITGQAKSHCVAWTIQDLLDEIQIRGPELADKIYLLEDCSTPVVIPGVADYTAPAHRAYEKFAVAGMHLVRSEDPIAGWPGIGRQPDP